MSVTIDDVRSFWERSPVCASDIPHPLGSQGYFDYFDRLRADLEPPRLWERIHEPRNFAGKDVLDVGCGNGFVLSRYAVAGARVTGVDLTQAGVSLSQARFALAKLRGTFRTANAESLPFPGASFDLVTSMGVLHHTPHPELGFSEIHRVLRPGGRLIIMVYHRDSALHRFKMPALARRMGRSLEDVVNSVDGLENPLGRVYSRAELAQLLAAFTNLNLFAGALLPEDMLPVSLIKYGAMARVRPALKLALRPFASRWGWFLYAKATKPE